MPKVFAIVGLPGSGKTTLAKKLALEKDALLFDDIGFESQRSQFEACLLENSKNIVVVDVYFCLAAVRKLALETITSLNSAVEIEWIYFENNYDACLKNIQNRNDGRNVKPTLERLTQKYQIPEWVKAIPIFQPDAEDRKS